MRVVPLHFTRGIVPLLCLGWLLQLGGVMPGRAQLAVDPALSLDTNIHGVLLSWPADPGAEYDVFLSPNWDGPWTLLAGSPLQAPLNQLVVTQAVEQPKLFFQVSKRDETAPAAWSFSPAHRAIGVSRRTPIIVSVQDDGVIDTNTISIAITNGPPINLMDPRLLFTGGQLTFTPGVNDLLGDFGQQVTAAVSFRDMAGNLATNVTWSFQLEQAPILDASVVVVSNIAPGLVLVDANGDLFTYLFTGDSSGLAPGQILVSSNAPFSYRRAVVSVTEDIPNHLVEVLTTSSALADSLIRGSVQFSDNLGGASVQPPPPPLAGGLAPFRAAAAAEECCSVTFTGRTIVANAELTAQVLAGFASFQPRLDVRGNFGPQGLEAMDVDLGGTLAMQLVFRATDHNPGSYSNRVSLGSFRKTLAQDFAGPVPAGAGVGLSFELVLESNWENPGTLQVGVGTTNLVSITSRLRNGQWTNSADRIIRFIVPTPEGETNPAAQLHAYVEVKLTVDLDGLAGTTLMLAPNLDAESVASAPPGFVGYDLLLFEGLQAAVAVNAQGWDRDVPLLALTNVFSERRPILHAIGRFKDGGPLVRPVADMVWIPAGEFLMGPRPGDGALPFVGAADPTPVSVSLTEGFFMGRYEVTQEGFLGLMTGKTTNFVFHHDGVWGTNRGRPMENITWSDATNYCRLLTQQERAARRIPATMEYRLPTEAEWEYACRAGTTNLYYNSDVLRPGQANYNCSVDQPNACSTNPVFAVVAPAVTLEPQPISVGRFAPNIWGLHDLHGNVHEWCLDWLGDTLPIGPLIDPRGAAASPVRAIRGGSYLEPSSACRADSRLPLPPTTPRRDVGFRIVLASAPLEIESYSLTIPNGISLIACQLERADSRISTYFPAAFMSVSKFNPTAGTFDQAAYDPDSGWNDPTSMTLSPGEAAFIDNKSGAPFELIFQGTRRTVLQPVPEHGLHYLSRQVPELGTFDTIALRPPVHGVRFNIFTGGGFVTYVYDADLGGWDPSEPPPVPIGMGVSIEFP
jgi:formylglycine-generating enzyme required for sulfatase activity